jgi:shikimate kinase
VNARTGIALIGPRAAGKTTLARALGARLRWPVLDGDDLLAADVGCPAGAFLAAAGEVEFRRVEEQVTLRALRVRDPKIVALGGGAVLSAAVREALRAGGLLVVFLEAPVARLVERQRGGPHRPPLTGLPLEAEIETLLAQRRSLYETTADFRLETSVSNVDACVAAILARMGSQPDVGSR